MRSASKMQEPRHSYVAFLCKGNKTELLQIGQQSLWASPYRDCASFPTIFPWKAQLKRSLCRSLSLSPQKIVQPLQYKSFACEHLHNFALFSLSSLVLILAFSPSIGLHSFLSRLTYSFIMQENGNTKRQLKGSKLKEKKALAFLLNKLLNLQKKILLEEKRSILK